MTFKLPTSIAGSARLSLPDPGYVPNTKDKMHCFQATLLMALRTKVHSSIPSMSDLDKAIGTVAGKYSWPYAGLSFIADRGFDVILWEAFDPAELVANGEQYLMDFFGPEVGADQIKNSDMPSLIEAAKACLSTPSFHRKHTPPTFEDVKSLLSEGYYLNIGVNQRLLQGDTGYIGHGIFAFGFGEDFIIAHNPGPPTSIASEIPWYLLDKAWSYPDINARTMYGFRPHL